MVSVLFHFKLSLVMNITYLNLIIINKSEAFLYDRQYNICLYKLKWHISAEKYIQCTLTHTPLMHNRILFTSRTTLKLYAKGMLSIPAAFSIYLQGESIN